MDSGFPKKTPTPRLLLRERLQPNSLLPSKFQQEKFPSTKKEASTGGSILPRIGPWIDLSETRPKLPSAPPKQNLLQISPPEVIFQNFNTHDVSEMTVSLMNVDKFPHVVKVSMERSPYFQVMGSNDAYRLLVPAVSVPVRIRFSPGENKDYSHQLVCVTERERIVVPIRAIAARAVLDFPDQLDFSTCPVKCSTQKTLLLRNTGKLEARFQLSTQRQSLFGQSQRELWLEKVMEEKETGKEKGSCEDRAASLRAPGEMAKVHQDPMFSDDVSFIEPMEGEIEPDGLAKIKMTFKPLEAVEYQSVACCSISGRESRLPLQLRGEGQGPLVELSCDTLELGDIFVNTPHVCEVNLINQGALDAPFRYIPAATKVGLGFKLAPQEGIIAAGGSQTLQISFSATVLGRFEEELRFSVAGSPTPAILTIRGSVTGPSLHFDLPELDFGDISFGFPYTQRCRLTNSSPVPVTFQLRMSFDGTQPAVDSVDQIRCHSDPAWRKGVHLYVEPREFTITPSQGTILPQGHQDIQVTLCSNSVMEFYRKMLVDLEGFGKAVASLVITARCLVPKLQVSPHVLQYDECLLKVPYEKKFLIRNPSHLPGCYGLIEQKRKEDAAVLYSSPRPCGIVQPHSTAEIPVLVEVQALGAHRTNVLIGVFGDERNPLRKKLWSSGRLAETSPSPRLMESGRTPALQPIDELHPPKFTPQPPKEMRTCLDCPASRWRHFKAGKQEAATALTEEQDLTQSSGAEASSILPVSGVLQPGESQQVSLPFSGHLNSISSATALCHVEGGPSSEVLVPGEASRVSCSPSPQEINCGSGAPLRERRELKRPSPKLEEETKALAEEERQKEKDRQKKEKKGVSVGKEPPKAEKGKTKPPEKKESKAPEKKDTKISERMETKAPDKIETKLPEKKNKHPEKKETKFPERKESKAPEKKDTKALLEKKETKFPEKKETKAPEKIENKLPEKKYKPPEKRESKFPEKKETKAPEKIENKLPEKKYKPPEKKEIKIPERKESKAPERKELKILKKETKSPEKRSKPPEKKETKCPERMEIKIPEKETKAPKKKEPKAPKKGEAKVPEKRETKAPKKKEPKAPRKGEAKAPRKGEAKA